MNFRLIAFLILAACSSAEAATLTTIHSFTGSDGSAPNTGIVIGPGGVLYGTASLAGSGSCRGGCGTVFSLTPPASLGGPWTESFYSLPFPKAGYNPSGVAVGGAGVLYGTTIYGGNCSSFGTVFELNPPASEGESWAERVLFNDCVLNAPTGSPVIGADGVLYVVTNGFLAPDLGPGSIITLSPPPSGSGGSWTETVLYTGLTYPNAIVFGANGTLYGTTYGGGVDGSNCGSIGCGTVYSLTPPATPGGAWTETTLYNFTGSGGDGDFPAGGVVIGPNGVLYGTTLGGGTGSCAGFSFPGCGTVFSLIPPTSPGGAWTERVLYRFTGGSDGANPSAGLAMGSHGVLYGTTANTGNGSCQFVATGCGTVFSLTPPASAGGAWTETILYAFSGEDGDQPGNLVIGRNGVLYGTTISGGASNEGTVFSLVP